MDRDRRALVAQDNATLHTDPGFPLSVGEDCVIGHNVILHGCSIGKASMIGMGAIVLNGAKIGANSLVGAGALVLAGKAFPDNSVILGSPAKAVRESDEAARAEIARAARSMSSAGRLTQEGSSASHERKRQVAILHRSRRHVHRPRGAQRGNFGLAQAGLLKTPALIAIAIAQSASPI